MNSSAQSGASSKQTHFSEGVESDGSHGTPSSKIVGSKDTIDEDFLSLNQRMQHSPNSKKRKAKIQGEREEDFQGYVPQNAYSELFYTKNNEFLMESLHSRVFIAEKKK